MSAESYVACEFSLPGKRRPMILTEQESDCLQCLYTSD